jgi:hypothetical protein
MNTVKKGKNSSAQVSEEEEAFVQPVSAHDGYRLRVK